MERKGHGTLTPVMGVCLLATFWYYIRNRKKYICSKEREKYLLRNIPKILMRIKAGPWKKYFWNQGKILEESERRFAQGSSWKST